MRDTTAKWAASSSKLRWRMLKQCFLGVGARFFLHKEALLVRPKCGLAETGCVLVAQKTTRSLTSVHMSYVLAITHISRLRSHVLKMIAGIVTSLVSISEQWKLTLACATLLCRVLVATFTYTAASASSQRSSIEAAASETPILDLESHSNVDSLYSSKKSEVIKRTD